LRLRGATGLGALSGARLACRLSRTLLTLLLLTLARARRARLHSAALPLRRLRALLIALAVRRSRLLLTRTVVLTGLAIRPLRLLRLLSRCGRRPQLLL